MPRSFAIRCLPWLVGALALGGSAQAAVIAHYTSGTTPGAVGVAPSPEDQNWLRATPVDITAVGFSNSLQGWRTADSSDSFGVSYSHEFDEGAAFGAENFGFFLRTVVKFDSDLVSDGLGSPAADDYFLPPDHGRQNGVFLRFYSTKFGFGGIFNIDAASNLFFHDGVTNHQLTSDNSAYDQYKNILIDSNGQSATLTLGSTTVTLADLGPQAVREVAFGTTAAGRGSAVWGLVIVDSNVPEPATASLLLLGAGFALRLRGRLALPGSWFARDSDGGRRRTRRRHYDSRSRNRRF
jgi:hypothetical protein